MRDRTRGSTGGLRGRKRDDFEGGIRVPGIVRWPGHIEPGTVSDVPVIGSDIFATVCDVAGIPLPDDRVIDGASMVPAFSGRPIDRPGADVLATHISSPDSRVAMRDGDWKVVGNVNLTAFLLFNLAEDPEETTDRSADEPERFRAMTETPDPPERRDPRRRPGLVEGRRGPALSRAVAGRRIDDPWELRVSVAFLAIALTFSTRPSVARGEAPYPGADWPDATPAELSAWTRPRWPSARDYALTGGGSGMIIRAGRVVMTWGDQDERYDLKSSTKSFGATALGVAIADGKVALDDRAADLIPRFGVPPESNRETGWLGEVTLRHLATQTAGFEKPGGYEPLLFRPGTAWHYSDGGPNWLAEFVTLAYGRDLEDWMFDRVFTPIGIDRDDLRWRENSVPTEADSTASRAASSARASTPTSTRWPASATSTCAGSLEGSSNS